MTSPTPAAPPPSPAGTPSPTPPPSPATTPSQPGARCFGDGDPLYEEYHDVEWGRVTRGDAALYERFSLEAFQSGLSWITVLRKRPAFRLAFAEFDPEVVARFDDGDVARLLADAGIVRNSAKVAATIANARAVLDLWSAGTTLTDLVWAHAPEQPVRRPRAVSLAQVPTSTAESAALARALKAAGFRFVGPTTAYAAMQACGLVDDHLACCPVVSARR
ncbi:DNA-3-methyladenine glycosylase I [Actinotalea sp.]|uniref:DNA-3-methyladenine glycosylase I n=1 Tax=Actinotalea sp. TaxID=1872145 RepID=UPI002C8FC541|nr:DNA-3-methyladenine glycosylase I [Actinotalea sp.]HQY32429.1 DNA-3-methyladenine glycosylase I [Actinotalea sp.]HRA49546.1 DNA-3-methyladenine glycosylase I [Actinotalea sp.]